ncbi:MAG: sensor histidine kinase, partial [Minisyncoccia bacterium]
MTTEELQKENETLHKENELKGEIISMTGHQVRTSLSAMKWVLKMFLDKDFGDLSTEQEQMLKKASEQNERVISLVSEMLTLNKASEGTIPYVFAPVEPVALVEKILFEFMSESYKKHIELLFLRPEHAVPAMLADVNKIHIVLENILDNAIKYSKEGDKVFISITPTGNMLDIAIKDTGIGIPTEVQNKIFTKFFRADNAQTKENLGSGIGLY